MKIKFILQKIIETITGKQCKKCKHHNGWFCDSKKHTECSMRIFPVGWEKKGGESDV